MRFLYCEHFLPEYPDLSVINNAISIETKEKTKRCHTCDSSLPVEGKQATLSYKIVLDAIHTHSSIHYLCVPHLLLPDFQFYQYRNSKYKSNYSSMIEVSKHIIEYIKI